MTASCRLQLVEYAVGKIGIQLLYSCSLWLEFPFATLALSENTCNMHHVYRIMHHLHRLHHWSSFVLDCLLSAIEPFRLPLLVRENSLLNASLLRLRWLSSGRASPQVPPFLHFISQHPTVYSARSVTPCHLRHFSRSCCRMLHKTTSSLSVVNGRSPCFLCELKWHGVRSTSYTVYCCTHQRVNWCQIRYYRNHQLADERGGRERQIVPTTVGDSGH